jgi:3-oxoacyl-[acyl-carrier-protein] synthase II
VGAEPGVTRRRVVVTGLGAVCGLGTGADALWRGLLAGTTAIREVERFDVAAHRTRLAAEVPGQIANGHRSQWAARLTLADRFAVAAAGEALGQAGLAPPQDTAEGGVFFGSSTGGMWESERYYAQLLGREPGRPRLARLVSQQYNGPGDAVARWAGVGGPVETVSSACTSGAVAIAAAADALRAGELELALAGGSDSLCQLTYAGFNSLRAVDPAPCLPFRAERGGMSLGEGAAVLVLEPSSVPWRAAPARWPSCWPEPPPATPTT